VARHHVACGGLLSPRSMLNLHVIIYMCASISLRWFLGLRFQAYVAGGVARVIHVSMANKVIN
jgi:hypothetical protein